MDNRTHKDDIPKWMRFTATATLTTALFALSVFFGQMDSFKHGMWMILYVLLWLFVDWLLFREE